MQNGKFLNHDICHDTIRILHSTNEADYTESSADVSDECVDVYADEFVDYAINDDKDPGCIDTFDLVWIALRKCGNLFMIAINWLFARCIPAVCALLIVLGDFISELCRTLYRCAQWIGRNVCLPFGKACLFVIFMLVIRSFYPEIGEILSPLYKVIDNFMLPVINWVFDGLQLGLNSHFAEGSAPAKAIVRIREIVGF